MPFAIPFPNIDPVIFSVDIFGLTLALRWYALAYLVGLVGGLYLLRWLARQPRLWTDGQAPYDQEAPDRLLTYMVIGVILGGRLGYVLFYNPAHFLANPAEILQVWAGGMSFHGGFLGVIVGVILFARVNRLPVLSLADVVAMAAPIGLLLGRIANFINGELWGRPSDVSWAVIFPHGGPLPRHPSQLYEAALEGALLLIVLWTLAMKAGWLKHPGRISGLFFIGYGMARSFVELFREPDAHFSAPDNPIGYALQFGAENGLTMGQMLSLPMILIGIGFIWLSTRKSA
ncbi:MAG: prolipoprotein diacylglyceryl transferase [Pikeienuella sp.]